jgi:hypothetical protein
MVAFQRPPAFHQALEPEPEVYGMEDARLVIARDIRPEAVVIKLTTTINTSITF